MTQSAPNYEDLIARKRVAFTPRGFDGSFDLNPALFPHQRAVTEFSLRAGSSAMFLDTGLGKSFAALEWGRVVVEKTNKPVLMLAPLAVGPQHEREAKRFGIDAAYVRDGADVDAAKIYITNYERLDNFVASKFGGIILDESSVLKSFSGITTKKLIDAFKATPYRLCCTATPAPNDHTELGTHAEFLGVMRRDEMLPRWFIHDSMDTGTWRIKGHAVSDFWRWVASWSRCVSLPSDIGFGDTGYVLPAITVAEHMVKADRTINPGEETKGKFVGQQRLFRMPDTSATSIHKEKRLTADDRADLVAECIDSDPEEPWIVWCDTDYEADAVMERVPGAEEVRGSMMLSVKEARLDAFSRGDLRVLVTKPSIAGYGLNWQHCARMAFAGLSFSYENYYQAIRRCWRFGQTREVQVHIAMADTEAAIKRVIDRKAGDHAAMKREMQAAMRAAHQSATRKTTYSPNKEAGLPAWLAA
ncbi:MULTISPECIES: helicase-related protein [unclassified Mesorhizobium]|uniref:helicase-related protein n=1 Tax=unclassified Mesorhizobium TaxID=325217 RepID=UPI00112AF1A4|nr:MULTISPECIES: helicase-related protein [unclassified Mesorhizobium]TPK59057.1 DEAD/DEAH box helicase [Mesorhizobium sp. B2-5-1]TPL06662.1 DEAD/DEAH box helicase [Mesorhizobium sp. B2-4-11]